MTRKSTTLLTSIALAGTLLLGACSSSSEPADPSANWTGQSGEEYLDRKVSDLGAQRAEQRGENRNENFFDRWREKQASR